MQPPHRVHPRRGGPAPPKYGSGTSSPGSPKKTATSVGPYVSPTPICSATRWTAASAGVSKGVRAAPSIRFASA